MIRLLLVSTFILSPGARTGQRVLLREAYSVGDVAEVRNEIRIRFKIETRGGKAETVQAIHREMYRTEVTMVDSRGVIRGFRRTYLRHRTDLSNGRTEVSSLEGKSVDARAVGRDVKVQSFGGELGPDGISEVRNQLTQSRMSLTPGRLAAVGEAWTVDPKVTARIFPGADKVSIRAEFGAVDKSDRARLNLQIEARGKLSMSPIAVTLKAGGVAYQGIQTHRPLSMDVQGTMSGAGSVQANDKPVAVKISGTMRGISSTRWIKTGK